MWLENDVENKAKHTSFKIFQICGFFLGGSLPVAIFLFLLMLGYNQYMLDPKAFGGILILWGLNSLTGYGALMHGPSKSKTFSFLFGLQALTSFLLVHILVLYSGGSKSSIFTFCYLYIPSVVGYAYGKRDNNLIGAALIMAASYIANLYALNYQISALAKCKDGLCLLQLMPGDKKFDTLFFIIFFIQLIMIVVMGKTTIDGGEQKNSPKPS